MTPTRTLYDLSMRALDWTDAAGPDVENLRTAPVAIAGSMVAT